MGLQREETPGAEGVVAARGAVEAVCEAQEADRALLGLLGRALVRAERERREPARVHEARDLPRVPASVGTLCEHRRVQCCALAMSPVPLVAVAAVAAAVAVRAGRGVAHLERRSVTHRERLTFFFVCLLLLFFACVRGKKKERERE